MKRTSLTRRLFAGAAGLMVGLVGVAALATPASAQSNDGEAARWGKVTGLVGSAECDPVSETWTVTWTVTNPSTHYNATVNALSSEVDGIDVDDVVHTESSVEGTQTFPSGTESASLTVELKWAWQWWGDWKIITDDATADVPLGECAEEQPPPTQPPPPTEEPEGPSGFVDLEFDCDTYVMIIKSDSESDVVLMVVPSEGDSYEVTVPAGETVEVEGPSAEGLIVDLQLEGQSVIEEGPFEITSELWTEAGCGGEGGELPTTGVSTGLIALGALALLAVGGGLFLVARRRRVTFTA